MYGNTGLVSNLFLVNEAQLLPIEMGQIRVTTITWKLSERSTDFGCIFVFQRFTFLEANLNTKFAGIFKYKKAKVKCRRIVHFGSIKLARDKLA